MTLDVFPDPRADVKALLNTAKPARWPTATISNEFPAASITVPHIQYAWDGTPSQQANRQVTTIRITVWTRKADTSAGTALAQLVRAFLLNTGSSATWRFRPGPGPSHGTDKATTLTFCTFNLTAETRPTRVS